MSALQWQKGTQPSRLQVLASLVHFEVWAAASPPAGADLGSTALHSMASNVRNHLVLCLVAASPLSQPHICRAAGPNDISLAAVGLSACLVLVNAAVSLWLLLGLEFQLVIAAIR